MAQQKAIDTIQPEEKRDWMRTAAYISQVINSISKTYGQANIGTELENLKKQITFSQPKENKSTRQ